MDTKLDAKLDTKFEGLERRMDPMMGIHEGRLDKHDAESASQTQLLEDLRIEVSSLRSNSSGPGSTASNSLGRGPYLRR